MYRIKQTVVKYPIVISGIDDYSNFHFHFYYLRTLTKIIHHHFLQRRIPHNLMSKVIILHDR